MTEKQTKEDPIVKELKQISSTIFWGSACIVLAIIYSCKSDVVITTNAQEEDASTHAHMDCTVERIEK